MSKASVLINASNLHVGGGVQVATSFLTELFLMKDINDSYDLTIFVSSEVNSNLFARGVELANVFSYQVFDVYGLEALRPNVSRMFRGFDLIFTIFGPLYLPFLPKKHIVGFAQAWIIYPRNDAANRLGFKFRFLARLKFFIQWIFFRMSDRLVVELEHVRNGLINVKGFPADRIDVVNNCVSRVYFDSKQWVPLPVLYGTRTGFRIGVVSRDYPHKNLELLSSVAKHLKLISNIEYCFFVTLSRSEWDSRDADFRRWVTNVGQVDVAQCPTFYQEMDAVIFPSLLESFSATPLEAMVMRRPLFASDRSFVHDSCGNNAIYFDPFDAEQVATLIVKWFENTEDSIRAAHVEKAFQYVLSRPEAKDRALSYIGIINRFLVS